MLEKKKGKNSMIHTPTSRTKKERKLILKKKHKKINNKDKNAN